MAHQIIAFDKPDQDNNVIEKRVFFITSDNQVLGTREKRAPRKLKKRLKSTGKYTSFMAVKGFDLKYLHQ